MLNKSALYLLLFDSPTLNLSVFQPHHFPHFKFANVFNIYFSTWLACIFGAQLLKKDMRKLPWCNEAKVLSRSSHVRLVATPWTATRLLCPWDCPEKNTGVGSHSLLQGIFSTQGSTLGLLHRRQILYQLNHQGSPWHKDRCKRNPKLSGAIVYQAHMSSMDLSFCLKCMWIFCF